MKSRADRLGNDSSRPPRKEGQDEDDENLIVRSIQSDSRKISSKNPRRSILLRQSKAEQGSLSKTLGTTSSGFVQGDFASGKIHDIGVKKCHKVCFLAEGILAVGSGSAVEFYETHHNSSLVCRLERTDTVSSIRATQTRLAVSGLDGVVSLYRIDMSVLEVQGPVLLHEFQVSDQVRSMALCTFGKLEQTLFLATADKSGAVTFCSQIKQDNYHIETVVNDPDSGGILTLAVHEAKGFMAYGTKTGKVTVHRLCRGMQSQVELGSTLWSIQRNGPARAVNFNEDGSRFCFGGYDKTAALVDTKEWYGVARELSMEGTISVISTDPLDRYMAVGCRDKSLTLFDTSTFFPVKILHTPGWVTSLSWSVTDGHQDTLAVRSENSCISLLDLTPIQQTNIELTAPLDSDKALSWSHCGRFLARSSGNRLIVARADAQFEEMASIALKGPIRCIAFCPEKAKQDLLAVASLDGYLHLLRFRGEPEALCVLELMESVFLEANLWVVAWSYDGARLATGGKEKNLHILEASNLKKPIHSLKVDGRVWDLDFIPDDGILGDTNCDLAVALGDYTTVFFDATSFHPVLKVLRPRTARSVAYHPRLPLIAVGDGAGMIAIVDFVGEQIANEFDVGGRVNSVHFSPMGDFLVVGTDDGRFTMHETATFKVVQEFPSSGFAIACQFSPSGQFLALGSSDGDYSIVRLGPLLGTDLVPLTLKGGVEELPSWALNEVVYRSGYGPSFVQRHMIKGSSDNLRRVATLLRLFPDIIHTFNRQTGSGFFDTALSLRKPNLLKLVVSALVDGTIETDDDDVRSILTTQVADKGRAALADILENHPPEFIVEILGKMVFVKVPFAAPYMSFSGNCKERASPSFTDPWGAEQHPLRGLKRYSDAAIMDSDRKTDSHTLVPAVLPLPGLGTMDFLSSLIVKAPPTAFDNDAMAVVLRVMWKDYVRKYFIVDCILFFIHFLLWTLLVDRSAVATTSGVVDAWEGSVASIVLACNVCYTVKELKQSDLGRRRGYIRSFWNVVDVFSIVGVYSYTLLVIFQNERNDAGVPLAVVTTLLLTLKLLSYLRGFHFGWLISVLIQNFKDVRGFLLILFSILTGFSISFRVLFDGFRSMCEMPESCGSDPFGSLRRSFLSTFELTVVGSYDPALLQESKYQVLAVFIFVLAVTIILVVALNALISVLADSYTRVQENATANRRKERAELVVEYLSLLPPWRRRMMEHHTKYFHALLEADADGDLRTSKADWEGGLNAIRRDFEELNETHAETTRHALEKMKEELEAEILDLKRDVVSLLEKLGNDVSQLQRSSEAGITLNGQNVVKAVNAVKSIGPMWRKKK